MVSIELLWRTAENYGPGGGFYVELSVSQPVVLVALQYRWYKRSFCTGVANMP